MFRKRGDVPVNNASKKFNYFPFLIFAVMILATLAFGLNYSNNKQEVPTCGDVTFYNSCSLVKPYCCSNGSLVEKASLCGCFANMTKSGESCLSSYQIGEKNVTLNYVLRGKEGKIIFPVYSGMDKYLQTISRTTFYAAGEQPLISDFKLKSMNEPQQMDLLLPLVEKIQNITTNRDDQVRIAISIIQNIPYGPSNLTTSLGDNKSVNYSRYPYEVLYDNMGVCSEKSTLLAFVLKEMGYGVAFLYYAPENNEAVGIKCPVKFSVDGTGYCIVETVGPSIITDDKLQYVGGTTLYSAPQVIPISQGASIGDNWPEFQDAKQLESLMKGGIPYLRQWELSNLEKKYGLGGVYNLA